MGKTVKRLRSDLLELSFSSKAHRERDRKWLKKALKKAKRADFKKFSQEE